MVELNKLPNCSGGGSGTIIDSMLEKEGAADVVGVSPVPLTLHSSPSPTSPFVELSKTFPT